MRQLSADNVQLEFCYEAKPTGYGLYRLLRAMDLSCIVVAPSLIPVRQGERVKTDRRDALRLAQLLRTGELTPVWVPTEAEETLRDLVRAREDVIEDRLRARHRLSKFFKMVPFVKTNFIRFLSYTPLTPFFKPDFLFVEGERGVYGLRT
ncbi:IS110 family transposase [Alicyclobacillus herbarius]|uniref:IS110 family transposase n=1 Tax=Alicyclobacillus herbarius TaxID=122960 RepID=UPI00047981D8|nr:IS110 family transposase [Alicyclobacillus herbarius]